MYMNVLYFIRHVLGLTRKTALSLMTFTIMSGSVSLSCFSLSLSFFSVSVSARPALENRVERYTAKLKKDYGYASGTKAQPRNLLFTHINQLLQQAGMLTPSPRSRFNHPFSQQVSMEKDEFVTTTTLYQSINMRLHKRSSFSVLGLNPAIRHRCDILDQRCWILHPSSHLSWLELDYNPSLSEELSRAISMAILVMQKS